MVEEVGERVADQIPKPGSFVPKNSSILLYTQSVRFLADIITVPNLQGIEIKKAASLLGDLSLGIKCTGMGEKIVRQYPEAGSKVSPGTQVEVYCE